MEKKGMRVEERGARKGDVMLVGVVVMYLIRYAVVAAKEPLWTSCDDSKQPHSML